MNVFEKEYAYGTIKTIYSIAASAADLVLVLSWCQEVPVVDHL